ncbi:MAG: hypothetical protein COS71_04195, partial [Candidatus Moranbacteria bacterium CG06_land_8_20_14_3_00_40_12]
LQKFAGGGGAEAKQNFGKKFELGCKSAPNRILIQKSLKVRPGIRGASGECRTNPSGRTNLN